LEAPTRREPRRGITDCHNQSGHDGALNLSRAAGRINVERALMDPLVPAEVDLRNFTYMPLDVVRLRDSDLAGVEDAEVFRAAVMAWCAAWHQVPAASLPDDDAILARLTGYGRDLATWRRVREGGALRGFVRCSDGRLYHRVVAEKALEAWEKKARQSERTKRATDAAAERARIRRESVTDSVEPSVTDSKGEERRGTEPKGTSSNENDRDSSASLGARASPRADRGTRLPADWEPSNEERDFALALGIDPGREAATFRDYWHGKPGAAGRKSNWTATWRNWVRRTSERRTTHGTGSRERNGFIVHAEQLAREDADRAAGRSVVDFLDAEDRG
jgi:hypothetical protein